MKRLLIYLGLLATLLAMPYHAKADNMLLHFWGGYVGDYVMGGTGDNTWAYSFYTENCTDQTVWLLPKANNDVWMKAYDTETYSDLGNGSSVWCWKEGGNNIHNVSIKLPSDYNTTNYKVTISATDYNSSNYSIKLTVTWEVAIPTEENVSLRTDAYKRDNNVDWIGIRYNEFDSENNVYTWYLNTIDGFTASSRFKLELGNIWYGNSENVGGSWTTLAVGSDDCTPTIPTLANGQVARLEAKKVGGNWQARIVAGDGAHDYYWVSPQITNGEKWPSFKMVPSRNRYWDGHQVIGDGLISTKYYTFTIKDDDLVTWKSKSAIGTGTQIQWYILRDDDVVVYRPTTDLTPGYLPHSGNPYGDDHPISGQLDSYVSYINFWNGSNYDGATAYKTSSVPYNTGSWSFRKGSAKAHTFNLNVDRGHVLYNYTTTGASDASGYKLAGNWTAGREVSIDISEAKPMTPYYYKNGVGSTSYVAESDSIVYKISVDRPEAGWGGLYLDVLPASNANWDHAIRPLITLGNSLDGRALHGAMTTARSDQSLNPEASPNYLGYTFSFNATTMTYRLEFHTPDATLSPGTEDGNVDFKGSVSEDIAVDLTDGSDGIHTEATQYAIGFGADAYFDLSETNKYTDTKFNLSFNGSTNEITYTSAGNNYTGTVSGSSIYVKVRGFDSSGNYGDIHTYKYTFHSSIGFEPHGGLFINSAKINIEGGVPPYRYEIWHYNTKTENGETVIDYTTGTLRSSGTFSNTSPYDVSDDNFRISTPGFLKIIDRNDDYVSFEEVGGGFDFTYSTSENYKRNTTGTAITTVDTSNAGAYPNGADYWLAAPGDLTRLLSPTWHLEGLTETRTATNVQPSWNGEDDNTIPLNKDDEIYQTVTGLAAGTYTVQAIVRGEVADISLKLDDNVVNTITLTGDGLGSIASINPYGRCEHLENMQESTSDRAWHKLEGSADVSADGSLKIAISAEGIAYVADVVLLKDANTTSGFRTTASTSPTDITRYDFRRRQVSGQPSQRQNNAYSFFDRGKNQNAVIFANNKTVIAMDKSLLAPECPNRDIDRRHPFNVVGSTEQDAAMGTAKALYLTDAGYDESDANRLPVRMGTSGDANYNSTNYRTHGYTFCPGLAFYAEDLIFDRDMSQMAVKKTTCMLPVAFTPAQLKTYYGDDLKVYKWTNISGNDLTFEQQADNTALNANEPYIFWGAVGSLDTRGQSAGKTDGKFTIGAITSTDHNAAANHSGFPGTYAYMKLKRYGDASGAETDNINDAEETRFIYSAANGVFSVVSKNGANLKPFRAYFVIPVTDKANEARQLNIFFDDSIITGVDSVETTAPTSGDIYTIGGVLVAKDGNMSGLPKGIYIMNGKKYVVK